MSQVQRAKPPRWTFTPGLVDPRWRWAWSHCYLALPFWERGGSAVWDVVGRRQASVVNHAAANWVATPYGAAYNVPSNTAIDLAARPDLNQTGDLTAEAVVRMPSGATLTRALLRFYSTGSPVGFGWYINVGANNGLPAYFSSAHGAWVTANTDVRDGKWHHLAISVTSAACAFYLDGRPDGAPTSKQPTSYTGTRRIGLDLDGTNYYWGGDIALVACHRRAMTAPEIARLAADPFGRFRPADEAPYVYSTAAPPGGSGARSFVVISA